ncbi:TonB-linked outer membrane protein, SusC/RagA family [Chitinophaga costaii]|uniref:TonB-linked outer membrane protein, SusC/RagA family n=1 Tax=Chitinophaga costaii TaxID=1335309 RepID=A0A1C4CIJ7_9BACT|nr:TonB-dependent receptor [Chitinophaga costaii]PUZ27075.1 TonB-dependent receptor [Chitinophaga costaii]SCC18977.1 TonB-linked outer membrane protein, SusC/RagA family [Chitinophaga costaii]
MKLKFLAFLALLLTVSMLSIAQNISVHGSVSDTLGNSLPGVTIRVVGTANGTTTDVKGEFTLNAPGTASLEFSYIGYKTATVAIGNRENLIVHLSALGTDLNQVVVVGYGTQRKKDLTGSVSVVNAADFANRPIVNAAEALQGKAAGVQVTSVSGKPGAGLSIRIRGSSSISSGNDPLYVVDGIITPDINAYNADDIESFSVLKDAASTAIYGTRAANGVVIITTKKGRSGKDKIDVSAYWGDSKPTKMLHVLNAKQYQSYMNESFGEGTISDSLVNAVDINWPDEAIRHGNQQNYHVAASGGSEKTQHYISVDYNNQVGMIRPSKFDRLTGRVNINSQATKWLTVTSSTIISRVNNNDVTDNLSSAKGGVVASALTTPPTVPEYAANGWIGANPSTGWENPLGAIKGSRTNNTNDRLVSNLGADIKIFKDLVVSSHFGIDYKNDKGTYFLDPFLTNYGRGQGGSLSQTTSTELSWLSEQTVKYNHRWGKSNFGALAGWTVQNSDWQQTYISASRLDDENRFKPFNTMWQLTHVKGLPSISQDQWALISYLGRVNYDWDGKYLFEANIRDDKSSKFSPDNRNAAFPSVSVGWRISQEPFMQNVRFVNDLKLRAGWGQNGNQEGIGSYDWRSLYTYNLVTDNEPLSTNPSNIASNDLRWETTSQTNVGFDASLLNNRLTVTGDFYWKKTKNVLLPIYLSGEIVSSVVVNQAQLRNVGQEVAISSKNIVGKDFNWSTDFNISFNQNTVQALNGDITSMPSFGSIYGRGNAINLIVGHPLGEFYGYIAGGVDPNTGQELYRTSTGELAPYGSTDGKGVKPSDRRLLGNAQPTFVYGLTNNLSYKNFNLSVFIQGSQGNKIYNGMRTELEGMMNTSNQSTAVLHRWKQVGDITDIPAVSPNSVNNSVISTRFLENGSYLRFKTITLSYNIPERILNHIGIGSASVYISGQNLITITKYTGFDPEVSSYAGPSNSSVDRNVSLGIDNGAYPQAKTFLAGINISLK